MIGEILVALASLVACEPSGGMISHQPHFAVPPVQLSEGQNSPASQGQVVGAHLIACGVDYSWGGREVIFPEPGGQVIWGVNQSGRADMLASIDAAIVIPGTGTLAETGRIVVQLQSRANTSLTVFDPLGGLLGTKFSAPSGGSYSHQIEFHAPPGSAIGYFRASKGDNSDYGIELTDVHIAVPAALHVPEPSAATLALIGLAAFRRVRKTVSDRPKTARAA